MTRAGRLLALGVGLLSPLAGAAAQEAAQPLAITVHPSGYAPGPETLEQKIARRTRESELLFRHICRNCGAQAGVPGATFEPQAALDAARRSR